MKIVYFDTIAGISGDMVLGAFVSAGLSLDELEQELMKLSLQGFELKTSHIERSGIVAVKLDVVISVQPKYHRHLKDIIEIIDRSELSASVKDRSKKVFHQIAVAEAKVHNTTIEKIHFHEVGALDSIVDIIGAAICLEKFGIERVYSSPVKLGSGGFSATEHGQLPIPTPATLEILKDYPAVLTDINFELTTPTGAAIIKALSSGVLSLEIIRVQGIGYGAGKGELEKIPNVLRVIIGELEPEYDEDELVTVETNIDDLNPELYPFVVEQLMAAGAHDAYLIPIIMKKGRPGILLSVLVNRGKLDPILKVVFTETTTLGVRIQHTERKKLPRIQKEVETSFGKITVKAVVLDGVERLVPEFEECRRIAIERKLALIEVYRILESELRK
ncbi:MAG: nickel pincer cofactor biosynthesis protein LarC [Bacteroidota bacterium]